MADIRIKDLTTLESASLTGDVFVIDGTTGTRKLSAFSPSFGGNATVTGTLSSAGNLSVTGTSAQVILGQASGSQLTYLIRPAQAGGAIQIVQDSATVNRWLSLGRADNSGVYVESMRLNDAGVVSISATTASTTTSTGALVVGNGTSGGLGVGGAIYAGGAIFAGGNIQSNAVFAANNTTLYLRPQGATVSSGEAQLTTTGNLTLAGTLTMAGEYLQGSNVNFNITSTATSGNVYIKSNGGTLYLNNTVGNGDIRLGNTGTVAYVIGTTASTSTSSGALVVSGGVGVAGAINAGGTITSTNGSGSGLLGMRSSSGNASYVFWSETGVADRGILGFNNGSSTLSYRSFSSSFSTGTEVFSVTSAGNITTGGNITTAAPAGGTAAAWKLGTVATVSPTSPNRTIEVDIGGTIYYLAAKTTNN